MTVASPETGDLTFLFEDAEFEIPCDISGLAGTGLSPCKGDPAEWVARRSVTCPCGITHRLVCDYCKRVYQAWCAVHASIVCAGCDAETFGFDLFSPLRKKS